MLREKRGASRPLLLPPPPPPTTSRARNSSRSQLAASDKRRPSSLCPEMRPSLARPMTGRAASDFKGWRRRQRATQRLLAPFVTSPSLLLLFLPFHHPPPPPPPFSFLQIRQNGMALLLATHTADTQLTAGPCHAPIKSQSSDSVTLRSVSCLSLQAGNRQFPMCA
jgi:hypothetical protein